MTQIQRSVLEGAKHHHMLAVNQMGNEMSGGTDPSGRRYLLDETSDGFYMRSGPWGDVLRAAIKIIGEQHEKQQASNACG